jgi:uncharacterized membrane protein YagU involved in acid resistance
MSSEPLITPPTEGRPAAPESVQMPRPTAAPLVLALGMAILAAGVALGTVFFVVGALVLVAGLSIWVAQLLPGRGHVHESLAEPARRPRPVTGAPGGVERLLPGMPGYRFRLPQDVHPVSAGIKGGIVGGVVMPVPALLWGLLSGHGLWYPVNLLAGMVLPGVGTMDVSELEQFRGSLLLAAVVIHVILSIVLGLIYGVLLATLPSVPRPIAWGALLMPLLWTGTCYALMDAVNPTLARGVSWPWFIWSQFLYGAVAAVVVMREEKLNRATAGLYGGMIGGLLMPVPAIVWGLLNRHGFWYPVNLLAGLVLSDPGRRPPEELEQFHASWLVAAIIIHALLSAGFGVVYGLLLPKLPSIPGPVAWGGVILPLMWTGTCYGLMGVVNPVLQQRVDWPWFVVSQFEFGVAAAVVVLRSEMVHIPPAGRGRYPVTG